jgi:hypothetical protein
MRLSRTLILDDADDDDDDDGEDDDEAGCDDVDVMGCAFAG